MENVWNSCTIYIILFVIALFIITDISSAFIFFHWQVKKYNTDAYTSTNIKNGAKTEKSIYQTYKLELSKK